MKRPSRRSRGVEQVATAPSRQGSRRAFARLRRALPREPRRRLRLCRRAASRHACGRGRHRPRLRARVSPPPPLRPPSRQRPGLVFGIARNAALDELRRRRRTASLQADPEDLAASPPGDDAELALRRAALGRRWSTRAARPRADRAPLLRRAQPPRDRRRARDQRLERRHPAAPGHRQAEEWDAMTPTGEGPMESSDLTELAVLLRAERPEPDPGWAATLDAPRRRGLPPRRRRRRQAPSGRTGGWLAPPARWRRCSWSSWSSPSSTRVAVAPGETWPRPPRRVGGHRDHRDPGGFEAGRGRAPWRSHHKLDSSSGRQDRPRHREPQARPRCPAEPLGAARRRPWGLRRGDLDHPLARRHRRLLAGQRVRHGASTPPWS